MSDAHVLGVKRAAILWLGAGLLLGFNIFAASQQSVPLVYLTLAFTGAFAVFGIGFGIWAAKKVTARPQ